MKRLAFGGGVWTTIVVMGYFAAINHADMSMIIFMTLLLMVTMFVIGLAIGEDD